MRDTDDKVALLKPAYPMPYGRPTDVSVKAVLDRVLAYIDRETQVGLTGATGERLKIDGKLPRGAHFLPGFRLNSYEWGVTYSGALLAGEVTGDKRFTQYAADRLNFVNAVAANYRAQGVPARETPVRDMLNPDKLDDAGAMAAAMIKAERAKLLDKRARPQIDLYLNWVANKQFRLADGTLARTSPYPNTLWLDDLYMSVPALAQMGALTGERRYFDDAVRQVLQFSQRMFVPEKKLYQHGWVQEMSPHPALYWARPDGWAIMAIVELLEVLPADHPGRAAVLAQLGAVAEGLAKVQSDTGLWHQLLDRPDTYLETSASAIYAFALARAVNRGWLDPRAYAPVALLAWNGVTTKVNAAGEVEDVVVGTGMGFDPAFYAYRPRHVAASHGYGPVLLAGAEVIALLRKTKVERPPLVMGYNWRPAAPAKAAP
ncbi:glycoside hydrolase family 88/105 protein [Sphingomonas aracearum]|nr:glycoside hydrolase family 88 protein [Sphingomonas aracearum]